jgi:hypothetical protein
VLALIRPGNLVEQWRVLQACAAAGKIVIMQAANFVPPECLFLALLRRKRLVRFGA